MLINHKRDNVSAFLLDLLFCAFTVLLEGVVKAFQETLHALNTNLLRQDWVQSFSHRVFPTLPAQHPEAIVSDGKKRERCSVTASRQHGKAANSRWKTPLLSIDRCYPGKQERDQSTRSVRLTLLGQETHLPREDVLSETNRVLSIKEIEKHS